MALLLGLVLPASVAGQTTPAPAAIIPIGADFPSEVLRDLPLGDNVYSLLETTQPEVISDRFSSGGMTVGNAAREGGFLGSWSQTRFRIGDLDVSDPSGSGSSLFFPDTMFWQRVRVTTEPVPFRHADNRPAQLLVACPVCATPIETISIGRPNTTFTVDAEGDRDCAVRGGAWTIAYTVSWKARQE